MSMFGESETVKKLKQQLAEAQAEATHHQQNAEYHHELCQERDKQLAAERAARKEAEIVARTKTAEVESLQEKWRQKQQDSPFIRVGKELVLYTDIKTITPNERGQVDKVNGREVYGEECSAQDLADLVEAFSRRDQGPAQGQA